MSMEIKLVKNKYFQIAVCSVTLLACFSISGMAVQKGGVKKLNVAAPNLKDASSAANPVSEDTLKKVDPVAVLNTFLGQIDIVRNGQAVFVKKGIFLYPKDAIKTQVGGKAELFLVNGTNVVIDENSIFTLKENMEKSNKGISVFLNAGKIWNKVVKGTHYEVETFYAVASVKGTEFTVNADNKMTVAVNSGAVMVSNSKGSNLVSKSEQVTTLPDQAPSTPTVSEEKYVQPSTVSRLNASLSIVNTERGKVTPFTITVADSQGNPVQSPCHMVVSSNDEAVLFSLSNPGTDLSKFTEHSLSFDLFVTSNSRISSDSKTVFLLVNEGSKLPEISVTSAEVNSASTAIGLYASSNSAPNSVSSGKYVGLTPVSPALPSPPGAPVVEKSLGTLSLMMNDNTKIVIPIKIISQQ